jgi:hypothetical protein
VSKLLILLYTVRMQALRVSLLSIIPIAWMAALKELSAALPGLVLALLLAAEVLLWVLDVGLTEPALLLILIFFILLTSLAQMVGLSHASRAKVLLTIIAPDPVLAHMLGRLLAHSLAVILLEIVVNIPLDDFYYISTVALD